jgi:hypothetical protein
MQRARISKLSTAGTLIWVSFWEQASEPRGATGREGRAMVGCTLGRVVDQCLRRTGANAGKAAGLVPAALTRELQVVLVSWHEPRARSTGIR